MLSFEFSVLLLIDAITLLRRVVALLRRAVLLLIDVIALLRGGVALFRRVVLLPEAVFVFVLPYVLTSDGIFKGSILRKWDGLIDTPSSILLLENGNCLLFRPT